MEVSTEKRIMEATLKEVAELESLQKAGFILVPIAKWTRLVKDSTFLEAILEVYSQTNETYKLDGILKAILSVYGMQSVKEIQEETLKLETAKAELEKAKEAKKAEIMELLKRFTDGEDE